MQRKEVAKMILKLSSGLGWFSSPQTTLVLIGIIVVLFLFKPEIRKVVKWLKTHEK